MTTKLNLGWETLPFCLQIFFPTFLRRDKFINRWFWSLAHSLLKMTQLSTRFYELSSFTHIYLSISICDDWYINISLKNNRGGFIPLSLNAINEFAWNEDIKKFIQHGETPKIVIELDNRVKVNFVETPNFKALCFNFGDKHINIQQKAALQFVRLNKVLHAA